MKVGRGIPDHLLSTNILQPRQTRLSPSRYSALEDLATMNTSDESNLFQTDAQLAQKEAQARKAVLTKTIGSPIQLASRAIKLRIRGQDAWVAESGWVVRRVCLHVSPSAGYGCGS